ncbi:AmiS/UreI family transporter [Bacillus sp. JJ722]|uniref:AmiS/UreI family transporter n=1 Tax=Bacillus sp. JJ722 TaxID=3122973 RepID=UPI003000BB24
MAQVGLLLSGAALFLNSLMLSGKAEAKSVAVFNLFVGTLQVLFPFYLLAVSDQSNWTTYQYAPTFLFGFTFLYLGLTILLNLSGTGLGYFSLWVSIFALFYTVISIVHFHDYVTAVTWLMWAYQWFLFYTLNITRKAIEHYVSKVAMIQSWCTLTIPSLLYFIGVWQIDIVQQVSLFILLVSIGYFIKGAMDLKMTNSNQVSST